jgi:periplasmic protein TonB
MASPAEIAPQLPDTLPEDFGEWDGGAPPATLPVHSDDQHADSEVGKDQPPPEAAQAQTEAVPEEASRQEAAPTAPSPSAAKIFAEGEAFLQRQKFKNTVVDHIPEIPVPPQAGQATNPRSVPGVPTPAPTPMRRTTDPVIPKAPAPVAAAPVLRESDEALFRSFRASSADEGLEEKFDKKKWIKVGGISAGALLVVVFLIILRFDPALLGMGKHTEAPSVTTVNPAVNPEEDANKPSPATPMTLGKLLSANAQPAPGAPQPTATATPTAATTPVAPKPQPKIESAMMDDQLNAPKRIPTDVGRRTDDSAPPSESINGLEGSNNALGSVFGSGKAKQKVAPEKLVTISAGVAGGLLIQKTAPLYPQIAKLARVSGTVVLKATISTSGTLSNIQVVSGPDMLQHAALDAVKNWRYRPYTVNNVPTSVETTVNVIFSLNQ